MCCLNEDIDLKEEQKRSYESKNSMTNSEKEFYKKLTNIFKDKYAVQFQVPLSAIIKKVSDEHYQNELYRIIDFALFDLETFKPVILIELNDKSHLESRRKYRDMKVNEICKNAGVKIITFWTNYENKEEYIKKRILDHINN